MPNGIMTLDSHYLLQRGDYEFLNRTDYGGIVFSIDGDISAIEFCNMNPDPTYGVVVSRITA